ncbi:glycosyltransferase family 4 protein [Acinetobacter lwoffii]|uniref:glycosyltransferase family 4 protein n=1 Tax=Acinetobacter lwoffii TaxID=28090 RepID=UPI001FB4AA1A|nr:glycosyltransferase family 4 protein [Acinetobacter lwoffii]MCJ0927740.1 glycosyltransferase family 4 protein [Acinetobacter lwoffii]
MKNVLFVALDAYSKVGGIQQFNKRVISGLLQNKELECISVILKDDKNTDFPENHIKFKTAEGSKFKLISEVIRNIRSQDILLIGHVNLLPIAFIAKFLKPSIKTILFVHGIDVWGVNSRKIKKLDRYFIKFVDQIASVSNFTACKMSESFLVPQERFSIFPNAVDPLDQAESSLGSINKTPILLTVARLSENERGKHHDSVLRALPKIIQAIPDVKYRIIGDGVLRTELEGLAESLGISHAVEFKGRVSDEELAKSYEEASIFVMPSEKEGFGIVFLEAWLRKIPVICGTQDASHEVVSHGVDGFAIHHHDIDSLSEKIIFLLENKNSAINMGKAGHQKVLENYLMNNFVKRLNSLLKGEC